MSPTRDVVATALAHADEHEQAAFFNAFARELRAACKSEGGTESQVCYFVRGLDNAARLLVDTMTGFVALEREHEEKNRRDYVTTVEAVRRAREELQELEARKTALLEELQR